MSITILSGNECQKIVKGNYLQPVKSKTLSSYWIRPHGKKEIKIEAEKDYTTGYSFAHRFLDLFVSVFSSRSIQDIFTKNNWYIDILRYKNKKVFNYHISILLHIYNNLFNIHVRIDCKERSMDISATEFFVHL